MVTAKVYMDGIGNVCFDIGKFHLEVIASAILTEIKSVLHYDDTGYIVIDTNYGEEFYSIPEHLHYLGLDGVYDIKKMMQSISGWKIVNKTFNNKKTKGIKQT